ncbi:hypothetical protein [Spirosoma foliorum]|uniref:Uncharacterized protein n=1 Tax=Spirosoma foliorum TaxID=2710596 RepID=A0A7G5GQ69_9BACT|nr:hypothetical protein [Spirosoma foliorum]QMW01011.1 hypothetical protein H3H32_23945 [Spirosoma foliorum]
MRDSLILAGIILAGLAGFAGFCYALTDWALDVKTGVYERNHVEAFYETAALVVYGVLSLRFIRGKLSSDDQSHKPPFF